MGLTETEAKVKGKRVAGAEVVESPTNNRNLPLNREILVNMEQFTLHIDNQGRVMLPVWWRRKEGVDHSTELCVAVTEEGALVVETREQGLRRARALLRKYIPEGVSLSDELIAERRAEAAREAEQRP